MVSWDQMGYRITYNFDAQNLCPAILPKFGQNWFASRLTRLLHLPELWELILWFPHCLFQNGHLNGMKIAQEYTTMTWVAVARRRMVATPIAGSNMPAVEGEHFQRKRERKAKDDSWSRGCFLLLLFFVVFLGCGDVTTRMVCPKTNAPRKTCTTFQTYRET